MLLWSGENVVAPVLVKFFHSVEAPDAPPVGLDAYATFGFVGNLVKINTKFHSGQTKTEAVFSVPDMLTLCVCVFR